MLGSERFDLVHQRIAFRAEHAMDQPRLRGIEEREVADRGAAGPDENDQSQDDREAFHAVPASLTGLLAALVHLAGAEESQTPVIDPRSCDLQQSPRGRPSYQLLGEIARGGMGTVLRAHDTDLGRDVALKVLNKDLERDPAILQRFVEEAQIAGQLQHPGVVPVYEIGLMADERPFFTMKLVGGRALSSLLRERVDPRAERQRFLAIFEQTCQAVAYAHSRGVIHRDLKPANVMVGAFGEVQVVDWGLAKVLKRGGCADEIDRPAPEHVTVVTTMRDRPGSTGPLSQHGSVMGTPGYLSPEQARGEIQNVDERSDVFSLGSMLCEILTGAPAYRGEDAMGQAREARLQDAFARLQASEADPELLDLCRRCLDPERSRRPAGAGPVAQTLHEHAASLDERARMAQVAAAEAHVMAREERKVKRLAISLATVVVAAGAGWAWTRVSHLEQRAAVERSVLAALEAGNLQHSRGELQAALASAEKASELAGARTIDPELAARAADFLESARSAIAAAELVRKREERRSAFRSTVDRLRALERTGRYAQELAPLAGPDGPFVQGRGDDAEPPRSAWEARERALAAAFGDLGLDPLTHEGRAAVETLQAAGLDDDAALALDSWARARSRRCVGDWNCQPTTPTC